MNNMQIKILIVLLFSLSLFIAYKALIKKNIKAQEMIFEFPKLKGSYSIGTTTRYIVDQQRKEPHNLSENRELMIHIWYPAEISEKNPLVNYYTQDEKAEAVASFKRKGYPEKDINNLEMVCTHAVHEAKPLQKNRPFPVVLFSHGYLGCTPILYSAFCEELASHGYIVVSIAHTYFAEKVTFPSGRTICPSPEKYKSQSMPSPEEQEIWIKDVKFVIDALSMFNINQNNIFFNFFDLKHIGMFGHSMGGVIAFQTCLKDERVKAGISLDGIPFNEIINIADLKKPFMFILAQDSLDSLKASDEELAQKFNVDIELIKKMRKGAMDLHNYDEILKSKSYIIFPNIKHAGFSDLLLLKEQHIFKNNKEIVNLENMTGAVDGFSMMQTINEHIVNFFDKHLKDKPSL